jgi:hypothetical protein
MGSTAVANSSLDRPLGFASSRLIDLEEVISEMEGEMMAEGDKSEEDGAPVTSSALNLSNQCEDDIRILNDAVVRETNTILGNRSL